jgi:hypothetical protein
MSSLVKFHRQIGSIIARMETKVRTRVTNPIGLWSAFEKIAKNINFLRNFLKNYQNTEKTQHFVSFGP